MRSKNQTGSPGGASQKENGNEQEKWQEAIDASCSRWSHCVAVTGWTGVIPLQAQTAPAFLRAGVVGQAPIIHNDSVNAYSYKNLDVTFRRGEAARIVVIGDGYSELDLYVYDENGLEVARDVAPGSNCTLSFVPLWTGRFRIRVVNNGFVYSGYTLMTN